MSELTEVKAINVDAEKKRKAIFVLQCQGKNLSDAVREVIDKYASEFENYLDK